jgi:MoxR-like ATPase
MDRLKAFWESRIARVEENRAAYKRSNELAEFGWWFISDQVDQAWAIANLKRVLEITERVEPDHEVVEKLEKLAEAMPRDVVECVDLMIRGARETWQIYSISRAARSILEAAVKSEDAETRRVVEDTINRLLARGLFEYRDLLSK